MKFINQILHRRIPQIVGSYLFAGSSLILFIDWLAARYGFPQYYVTLTLFGIASIIPSVLILAYFHGAPGKDEWTKIEKIGIPINIIFIGLVVIMGNNYGWWIKIDDGNIIEIEEPKIIVIAEIASDKNSIDFALQNIKTDISDIKLEILSEKEKNNIYDELMSKLEFNKFRDDIDFYTKYELIDNFNKKGQIKPGYIFKYLIRDIINNQSGASIDTMFEILHLRRSDKHSMYNYLINTGSDFGYFPLIYKLEKEVTQSTKPLSKLETEYFILHTIIYEDLKEKNGDTSSTFHNQYNLKVLKEGDLIDEMVEHISSRINGYLSVFDGVIKVSQDDNIIIKFDKAIINRVKPRMILKIRRKYNYRANTDDFDEFINGRIQELTDYEYLVNQDSNTVFYKYYYNTSYNRGKPPYSFTKDELNSLYDGTHYFYSWDRPGTTSGTSMFLHTTIQIEAEYDSTASAIIYKNGDPNIRLKAGDIVKH